MLRKICSILVVFTAFFSLTITGQAAVYRENFDKLEQSAAITYTNLEIGPFKPEYIDLHFAQMKNTSGTASVEYQLRNASSVTATIYMSTGTVVTQDNKGNHFLVTSANYGEFIPTNHPVNYSPSTKQVYTFPQGISNCLTYDSAAGFIFKPQASVPSDLINYGINFYGSSDGINYQRLKILRNYSRNMPQGGLIIEEWSSKVPLHVSYLRVELNDVSVVNNYANGDNYVRTTNAMTMLAQLEIEGNGLIISVAQPIIPEETLTTNPDPSPSKPESSGSAASKASSSKSATSQSESSKIAVAPKEESSAKFEGIVPEAPDTTAQNSNEAATAKSQAGGKFAGSTSPVAPTPKTTKEAVSEVAEQQEYSEPAETLYFIEPSRVEKKGNSSPFVIVYIAGVALIILLLLRKSLPK